VIAVLPLLGAMITALAGLGGAHHRV